MISPFMIDANLLPRDSLICSEHNSKSLTIYKRMEYTQ